MLAKAPYHRPVATRLFLSGSKVTSTRLSEMRASCLASWQSPSSLIQCFHWDRLYSGMSAGIGATVIAREVVGVGLVVVSSWVDTVVDVSVEDAGVGVTVAVVDPRSLSEKQCSKRYASLVECKDANYSTTKPRLL